MRDDRSAVARAEDRPAVDEAIIEQLASITDGQGFSVLGELLNADEGDVDAARPLVLDLRSEFLEVRAWLMRFRSRA